MLTRRIRGPHGLYIYTSEKDLSGQLINTIHSSKKSARVLPEFRYTLKVFEITQYVRPRTADSSINLRSICWEANDIAIRVIRERKNEKKKKEGRKEGKERTGKKDRQRKFVTES